MVIDLKQEQSLLLKLDSVHFLPISSSNIYFEEKKTFLERNLQNMTEIIPSAEMSLRNMEKK